MRKVNLAVCALALAVSSTTAFAATNGTVTFNGLLQDDTCQIETGTENVQVTLPTLATSSLANPGDEQGSKNFTISVVDCPAAVTKVSAHFNAINSDGVNATTGNLTNSATTGGATGAEVRLYNMDSSQIRVGDTGAAFNVTPGTGADPKGTTTLSYAGGYYATKATTPGAVTAKVQYVLSYN
ncbi:frimbrial protein [Yersinia intermedia]|uniref:Frimbrial protein n=1 Tax=Yersinia intermedia TaxID=631 RepID=A0A0T9N3Q4_YERIN|nr:fimbrial protein [Yersinia intermedia]AJJ21331.1 fimbrial family protein [Yersinia intermedia]MDA5514622.1 fimbrial protein [Yersinia intermedia]CNG75146.1 frimbrial protein [Yersinia intermedia]CNI58329.1 frimbrial protein [Yersinia intermedia]CQE06722.1 frimbrial protein [Yersinia intermedia]